MLPNVGPSVPRRGGILSKTFGIVGLRVLGWRIEGDIADHPRMVAIVAPHTSNWDFPVGVLARYALRLDASWLGKHTLFRPPFGWIMRRWGGIPVDRSSPHDVVAQTIESFSSRPRVFLVITPEGTRKQVSRWKSGFWHIAKGAGVPIQPIAFDWGARVVRILPAFMPREHADEDIAELQSMYAGMRGRTR
jgi:1-acyl-sn-glycerol-3-phosphate acyltransferase